jgi:soluble lytic murein transglycosylase
MRDGDYEGASDVYAAAAREATGEEKARALLGLAVALNAAGDGESALAAALESRAEAEPGATAWQQASFLAGRYLTDGGQFEEAVAILAPLADTGAGELQAYVLADLQRAAIGADRGDLAASAGDRLAALPDVPASLIDGTFRRNAAAALASGDLQRYASALEALAASTGYARDRFDLAGAYEDLGRTEDRLTVLRSIVRETPGDALAAVAVDELESAGETVDPSLKGYVYYRARRYVDAAGVLTPVVDAAELPPVDLVFATYYLAASLEDQGNLSAAVALYDRVPTILPDSPYAHRARYWAARVLENLEEYGSASARYVELVNTPPTGEFTAEAAFRAGYVHFTAGDPAGAVAAWDALGQGDARVHYWRGVAERALAAEAESLASFAAAVEAGPLDFHGVEAARAAGIARPLDVAYRPRPLSGPADWPAIESWLSAEVGGGPEPAPGSAAVTLASLGLRTEAEQLLRSLAASGSSPWRLLAVARQAHDLGLKGTAARLADRLRIEQGAAWHDVPPALLAVAYPIDFPAVLDREASEAGLDPLFLAALIRVESFWEPGAVSPVGALGLMQVMPETGRSIADALGVEGFEVEALLRPATSLKFGSYYIGAQVRQFGLPYVALAAYNGGPGRAARWLNAWDGVSAASFAETVDIDETRHYVELVLESYARYEAAYAEPDR